MVNACRNGSDICFRVQYQKICPGALRIFILAQLYGPAHDKQESKSQNFF